MSRRASRWSPSKWSLVLLSACVVVLAGLALGGTARAAEVDLGVIVVKQKAQAESLRARLIKGESFEALAREYSVGPAAGRGGRLGLVPDTRLRREYLHALKDLRPGTPSPVIPTEEGFTLLMRFDKAPAAVAERAPGLPASPAPAPAPSRPAPPRPALGHAIENSPQLLARQEVAAGLEAMAQGKLKNAEALFSKALGINPHEDSATFLLDQVRAALSGKFNQQAATLFAQGFLFMIEPNPRDALESFRKSVQIDAHFWPGLLFEANTLADMGRRAESKQLLEKVLNVNPRADRAYLSLGVMALEEKKTDEAAGYFLKSLEINPELAESHYRLGSIALFKGDLAAAEREMNAAVAIDPYKEEAFNDLGLIYGLTGRIQDAEKAYHKTLELNPAFPAPHVNLGTLYAQTGRVNQAIDEFNKALMIEPRMGDVHVNLAAAYIMKQDWAKAAEHADLAAKLGSKVPEVVLKKLAAHQNKK